MQLGEAVTAKDIEGMLKTQGLESRGLLPGDVLYIYTCWRDGRPARARQSVHRPGGGRLPPGQGRPTGGHAAGNAVCDPPS
jgi:hypothetical protein